MGSVETGVHLVVPMNMSLDIPAGVGFVLCMSSPGTRYKGHSVDLPNSLFFITKKLVARVSFLIRRFRQISKSDY